MDCGRCVNPICEEHDACSQMPKPKPRKLTKAQLDAKRERAQEEGMLNGIDAYNDWML